MGEFENEKVIVLRLVNAAYNSVSTFILLFSFARMP